MYTFPNSNTSTHLPSTCYLIALAEIASAQHFRIFSLLPTLGFIPSILPTLADTWINFVLPSSSPASLPCQANTLSFLADATAHTYTPKVDICLCLPLHILAALPTVKHLERFAAHQHFAAQLHYLSAHMPSPMPKSLPCQSDVALLD